MNLYFVFQKENNGYDTYSSFVCAATNEEYAIDMSPSNGNKIDWDDEDRSGSHEWASTRQYVNVQLIGVADKSITEPKIICSSYHAG